MTDWNPIHGGARRRLLLTTMLGGFAVVASPVLAQSSMIPSGGHVVAGTASISQPSASRTVIDQTSGRAIINWNDFSIGQGDSVQFNNGSGVTLNRVSGGSLSSIDGLLSATGSVYLINPNGVVVGKSGVVKTGGSFVASTLDVANNNILTGGDLTFDGRSKAAVVNLGNVGSLGGNVVLIAQDVQNSGSISASKGTVGLVAGKTVLMRDTATDQGLFVVQAGGSDTQATTAGTIDAASVELRANGGSIYALAGNTDGVITATGVGAHDGHIWLTAGDDGSLSVNETLKATEANGDGGMVETSAGTVNFDGVKVDTSGTTGKTGSWLVDPYDLLIDQSVAGTINGNLATTNITLQTTATGTSGYGTATAGGLGDITIAYELFWFSSNTLTIDAYHSINIDALINNDGPGKLVMKTNDGGSGGGYNFTGGSITFTGTGGSLTINGQAYTLIYTMAQLDALDGYNAATGTGAAAAASGYYALAIPLDASGTTYGAALVGTGSSTAFSGVFEGLGNTVSNLTISGNSADYIGLFGYNTGTVRDLMLTNESVSFTGAYAVGGLVGWNTGTLNHDWTYGFLRNGGDHIGGLAAVNAGGTVINDDSYSNITAGAATYSGGSAVGYNTGTINNVYAGGGVTQSGDSTTTNLGGVAGFNSGQITNAKAEGSVGSQQLQPGDHSLSLGGLVGWNTGTVSNSYNSGQLVGGNGSHVGGLVGVNMGGTVSNDYNYISNTSGNGVDVGSIVGWNSGTVDSVADLGFSTGNETGSVTGTAMAMGGLVGWNQGTVENSYATYGVNDSGTSTHVGGLVGVNNTGGTIVDSYATGGAFSSGVDAGGLIGYNAGNVSDSYATGGSFTSSSGASAGGLIGINASGGVARDVYAASINQIMADSGYEGAIVGTNHGTITGAYGAGYLAQPLGTQVGGVSGANDGTITAAYWDTQTTGISAATGSGTAAGTGRTTAQFSNSANFSGLTFTTTPGGAGWVIVDTDSTLNNANGAAGGTRPMLASEYSTTIASGHQLQLIAMNPGGTYAFSQLNSVEPLDLYETGFRSGVWNTSEAFIPIGTATTPFSGTLDGKGTAIFNFNMNGTGNYAGLFGYNTGVIKNVWIQSATLTSNAYASGGLVGWNAGTMDDDFIQGTFSGSGDHLGGIAGVNYGGTISNTIAYLSITASSWSAGGIAGYNSGLLNADTYQGVTLTSSGVVAGGVAGFNAGGTVTKSDGYSNISGSGEAIGGVVGWNEGGTISNDVAYAQVLGKSAITGTASHSGGLVGVNNGGNISSSTSYNEVVASGNDAGGLVGWNSGTLTGNVANGAVSGTAAATGGLVGYNTSTGNIGVSLATGTVTDTYASSHTGGLVGVNAGGTIGNTYAMGAVSGNGVSVGGLVGYNTGTVSQSFATGAVSGGASDKGGLLGYNSGTITASYWDTQTTTLSAGIGFGSSAGATGEATSTLKSGMMPAGFDSSIWGVQIYYYPYLKALGLR